MLKDLESRLGELKSYTDEISSEFISNTEKIQTSIENIRTYLEQEISNIDEKLQINPS